MQIEADKDDKSISVVEPLHIRDREFEPFAFRINDDNLPELVEFYQPQKRQAGRPAKEPFDPYKEITEDAHRSALNAAFEDGNISSYDSYLERLKEGYGRQGIKLGHNKAVTVSYTHLDVYKRQPFILSGNSLPNRCVPTASPSTIPMKRNRKSATRE